MQESAILSELDLAIINALQIRPRGEWSRIGAALGITGATAARHWERLTRERLAWIATMPGPRFGDAGHTAHVFLSASPSHHTELAERLCQEPAAATVTRVTGGHDFRVDCFTGTQESLDQIVSERFSSLPGVMRTETAYVTRVHRQSSSWRSGILDQRQSRSVSADSAATPSRRTAFDAVDSALLDALGDDGRRSWAELAALCAVSPQTARRRVEQHLASGYLVLRCEFATSAGLPVREASLILNVPGRHLEAAGRYMAGLPNCRVSVEVFSVHNLVATFWVHDLNEIHAYERELEARAPGTVVFSRSVTLRTYKRVGHILDREGRSVGRVPLPMWRRG
ncbi:Lrp/AsnC family transcriptional regulator [Streptomyces sp. NPDC048511]|uniref:Lrp/AsnC family transcriptional regulator n=1 Tax=Streptomyces sp. NBC_00148 TaxID=2903626 RepID=A0AAU1LKM0_9ACTN